MLRLATILMSIAVHAVVAYVSLDAALLKDNTKSFEQGTGEDTFRIEQGIGIEGSLQEGTAVETVEANDAPTPVSEARPQIDEVKPVEQAQEKPPETDLKDTQIIESKEGPQQDPVPVQEEKPKEIKQQAPQMATAEQLQEQSAVEEQKSAGAKQEGGDVGVQRAYLGKLHSQLSKAKVNPRSQSTGTVLVRFSVAPSGALLAREVVATSGSQILDNAALAAVDRAAPFPAFPQNMKTDKIVEVVPFRFSIR